MSVDGVAGRVARNRVAVAANPVRVADHDARRSVEPVLQVVTDYPEVGQPHPARPDGAGAGHAVALALLAHFRGHVRSSGFVVVQIHLLPQISAALSRIDEFTGELEAVTDVVGTTTPFPVANTGRCSRLMSVVAGAGLNASFAARSRYAVGHRGAGYRVDESGLPTTSIDDLPK